MNRILVTGAGGPAGINVIKLLKGDFYVGVFLNLLGQMT